MQGILCGLHFDDSRMPLFMETVKTDPALRDREAVHARFRELVARALAGAPGAE